jgi:EamA domain-containing membrane protein RarD
MTATGQGNQKNRLKTVSTEERAGSRRKGILFILMAAFFFSLMSVFVRLSGDVPTMQKAFFRNIVAAILAAVLLARSKGGFTFQKKNSA